MFSLLLFIVALSCVHAVMMLRRDAFLPPLISLRVDEHHTGAHRLTESSSDHGIESKFSI